MNWKKLLLMMCAIITLTTVKIYAKPINMNLFYEGKNHDYQAEEVKIKIDDRELIPKDMPAIIIAERVMLPMRQIAQELGCEVIWNEEMKQIYVMNKNDVVVFDIDSKIGYQNGKEFTMDVPAQIINNRTMLPIRALANALHLNITWDNTTRTVSIHTQDAPSIDDSHDEIKDMTLHTITLPNSINDKQVFTIEADGAITNFEDVSTNDNKIVLHFKQIKNSIPNKITETNSSIVSAIQTTTQEKEGGFYTQVILELKEKKPYAITQSADKTKFMITFDCEKIMIKNISALHNNDKDYITISATGTIGANVYTLSNPNRIVVDIPNAKSELQSTIDTTNLQYVLAYKSGMFTENTLRLVFETNDLVQYQFKEEEQNLILEISQKIFQNMDFENANNVVYLTKEKSFSIQDVKLQDHYLDGYFDVILPGNFENIYANGRYEIGGDVIQRIEVSTINGNTVFRFIQNRISVYEVQDKGDKYAIMIKNPKEVYDKVLLLDAGHGGKDPGTSGNGQIEKKLTLAVAQKVAQNLQNSGIKVYLTRDRDVYPENMVRAKTANQIADVMVSIHMNSGPASANGTEVLYQIHTNDDASKLTSKKLAEVLQSHIIDATGNTNRGVKLWEDVLILNRTTVPTALIEVVFLTNPGDALKISTESYQDQVAKAIADAIQYAMKNYQLR